MYVRMLDGRDRGQVLDVIEEEARLMLADGRAGPIDFSQADPLGPREALAELEPAPRLSPEVSTFVDVMAGGELPNPAVVRKPPAGLFRKRGR